MTFVFPSWKNTTVYLFTFPRTSDDPWQKSPFYLIFLIKLVSFWDMKCLLLRVFWRPCFLLRNFKEMCKKIGSLKVDKACVTRCSNSHFFFSVGMVYCLKLFLARPSWLLEKWSLHGLKIHSQQFSPNIHFKIFSTKMNLVCFINVCLTERITLRTRSPQETSIARFA